MKEQLTVFFKKYNLYAILANSYNDINSKTGSVIERITYQNYSLYLFSKFSIFILLIVSFISCTSVNKKDKITSTVFKYNEMTGITSLDPAAARSFENIWIINQLYNGLLQLDDSLRVEASIAKSWNISKDGLTYTFNLKNNVYFNENKYLLDGKGRKVIASDFVYSFNRLLDAKVSSATSLLLNLDNTNNNGFEAINDSTFTIHLLKPFIPFLRILTMKYFSVVPKEAVIYFGDDFRKNPK